MEKILQPLQSQGSSIEKANFSTFRADPEPSSPDTSTSASGQPSRPPSALRADPELPFLEMAWSPSQMQEFLNRQVLPAVWPDQQVAALAIDEMHYKPGKQCEITYSLQFANLTRGQSRWAVATFATENELGEIDRKSTRLNSSHRTISYAVFCLKKK